MKIAEQTSPIYEKIRLLCNNNNLEIFALYREIYPDCNSRGNLSTWRKGNFKPVDLIYISNRFGVSIDFLLKNKENSIQKNNENISGSNIFQDNSFSGQNFSIGNFSSVANKPDNELSRIENCWNKIPNDCKFLVSNYAEILANISRLDYYGKRLTYFLSEFGDKLSNYDFIRIMEIFSKIDKKDYSQFFCVIYDEMKKLNYPIPDWLENLDKNYYHKVF